MWNFVVEKLCTFSKCHICQSVSTRSPITSVKVRIFPNIIDQFFIDLILTPTKAQHQNRQWAGNWSLTNCLCLRWRGGGVKQFAFKQECIKSGYSLLSGVRLKLKEKEKKKPVKVGILSFYRQKGIDWKEQTPPS